MGRPPKRKPAAAKPAPVKRRKNASEGDSAVVQKRRRRASEGPGVFVQNAPKGTASQAKFENAPFAEGGFRIVYKGVYIDGAREGEECVMKEFKTGGVHEATFFEADIKAVKKAGELIQKFNDAGVVSKKVFLNEPEVWSGSAGRIAGHKVLVEPLIRGEYFKFNSNTGYAEPDTATMQALSHFSYHVTSGQYLLCDLQGGRYDGYYILTDPVLHSIRKEFGGTDLGKDGIDNFLAHHVCGRFCNPNWKMPTAKKLIPHFQAVAGTTFGEAQALFDEEERRELEIKVKKEVRINIRKLWEKAVPTGRKQLSMEQSKQVLAKIGNRADK